MNEDYGTIGPIGYEPGVYGLFQRLIRTYGAALNWGGGKAEQLGSAMMTSPDSMHYMLGTALRQMGQQGQEYGGAYTDWSQGFSPIQGTGNLTQPVVNRQQLLDVIRGAVPAMRVAQAIPGAVSDAWHDFQAGIPQGFPGITAYHGTPYEFSQFDPAKIGSGEGAQAYGHGIYAAENPETARGYAHVLGGRSFEINGKPIFATQGGASRAMDQSMAERIAADSLDDAFNAQSTSPAQFAANRLRYQARIYPENAEDISKAIGLIADWQESGSVAKLASNVYKLDIPDEHIEKMLDWDKPLSEQPGILAKMRAAIVDNDEVAEALPDVTGAELHNNILPMIGVGRGGPGGYEHDMAADWLRKQGIPGIKYLDAGSRASGSGTHNFVLFDPSIATITGKQ